MIPKIIHYCWFGNKPLPKEALRCIASWKKFLPDYTIQRWDESNFDVHAIAYTHAAYEAKKYAFVSDYARFKILYENGGLYFDTDVELIRGIDDVVERGAFMGCEVSPTEGDSTIWVAAGLGLGVEVGNAVFRELVETYSRMEFSFSPGKPMTTVVHIGTKILKDHGLKSTAEIQQIDGIWIYPKEYFCPIDYSGNMHLTPNTRSIHHYAASWRHPIYNTLRKIWIRYAGHHAQERFRKWHHKTKH